MIIALVVWALGQDPPAKYVESAKGVELPDLAAWREKSPQHAKAVAVIGDRAVWARGMEAIDERLGLFVAAPRIRVELFESDDPWPARGTGRRGQGTVKFNMRRLVEHVRKKEEFDELKQYGKEVAFRIPPTPLDAVITHELTHCYAGTFDDAWATEGLAVYAAREAAHMLDFQNRKATVEILGAVAAADAYARGYCALEWLAQKHGAAKVKEFVARIVEDPSAVRASYAAAAGAPWEEAVTAERDWSRAHLRERFTPRER